MEEITPFLSKIGLSAGIISLAAFLMKHKLVTLYSSTPLEKVFMSKERRLTAKILDYIVVLLVSSLITSIFTIMFYFTRIKFFEVFYILASMQALVFLFFLFCSTFSINYSGTNAKRKKVYVALSAIYIFTCYIMLPYYSGTVILKSIATNEYLFIFISTIISSIILSISPLIVTALNVIKFFNPKSNILQFHYIIDKENRIWYIYQPIEKEQILLGDTPTVNDCTEYIVMDKSEVLKSHIHVNKDDSKQ